MDNYEEFMNIKHFEPKHPRMSKAQRVFQFSSFKALTGYNDVICETERLTDIKKNLSDEMKYLINEKLNLIKNNFKYDNVTIKYFLKDLKKDGGKYIEINSNVKKVDLINKVIYLEKNIKVNIDDIYDIRSDF